MDPDDFVRKGHLRHMRSLVQSLMVLVQEIEERQGQLTDDDVQWLDTDLDNLLGIKNTMEDIVYD